MIHKRRLTVVTLSLMAKKEKLSGKPCDLASSRTVKTLLHYHTLNVKRQTHMDRNDTYIWVQNAALFCCGCHICDCRRKPPVLVKPSIKTLREHELCHKYYKTLSLICTFAEALFSHSRCGIWGLPIHNSNLTTRIMPKMWTYHSHSSGRKPWCSIRMNHARYELYAYCGSRHQLSAEYW